MAKLLSRRNRLLISIALIGLMALVGYEGGWVMGVVFGLIFSLLFELYSFIKEDTEDVIFRKLQSFDTNLNAKFSLFDDYKLLANKFSASGIRLVTSALTDIFDISNTKAVSHFTPAFILSSAIEPNIVIQKPNMFVLVPSQAQASTLFIKSFNSVKKSYWGTSFSNTQTWNLKSLIPMLEQHKLLVSKGIDVKRVFICHKGDPKNEVIKRAKMQRKKYSVDCKYIELETIKNKLPLLDTWNQLWSFYLRTPGPSDGKFVFLSPDFGIIDQQILISYLVDFDLNEIGAAVYYEPDFLPVIIDYYKQLFYESSYP